MNLKDNKTGAIYAFDDEVGAEKFKQVNTRMDLSEVSDQELASVNEVKTSTDHRQRVFGLVVNSFSIDGSYDEKKAAVVKVAKEKPDATLKEFYAAVVDSLPSDGSEVTAGLKPANGILVSDNFQDGKSKASYNLQVRNTAGESVAWVAVVSDAPYSSIPALVGGEYELEVTESDKGYTYTFSGKLAGYESITITGGVPSPVGNGKTETSPALYIK